MPQTIMVNKSIYEPDFGFQQYCLISNDTLKNTYYEKYFQSKIKYISYRIIKFSIDQLSIN